MKNKCVVTLQSDKMFNRANAEDQVQWPNDKVAESLFGEYAFSEPLYGSDFWVDGLLIRDDKYPGWMPDEDSKWNDLPWLHFEFDGDDVDDGVLVGKKYLLVERFGETPIGAVSLCLDGLVRAFGTAEPGNLTLFTAKVASILSKQQQIKEDCLG